MTINAAREQAQRDGYVECAECGHALEDHYISGCLVGSQESEDCMCDSSWSDDEITSIRRRYGLTANW